MNNTELPVTVTSCTGSKEHSVEVDVPPEPDSPGVVTIGDKQYLVSPAGDAWLFRQTKSSGGKFYTVRDRTPISCECGDFIHRGKRRLRCKHIQEAENLRKQLEGSDDQ